MKHKKLKSNIPLILRYHRLMDAFAKSDDERDFFLNKVEGFIIFVDLDKPFDDLFTLNKELEKDKENYCLIPKMTFYEIKKFMEGFINEKVYDIDTKEKLLDIIQAKEARENFLEFIYDNLIELEKWQQYYYERSRIKIIEWLRNNNISFVFEEDLELEIDVLEKVKRTMFEEIVCREIQKRRNYIISKSKIYYSTEALNPRPKRGRPPKQTTKIEIEPSLTPDIYKTVTNDIRQFLFMPDFSGTTGSFSGKFDTDEDLIASLRGSSRIKVDSKLEVLSKRLESMQELYFKLKKDKKVEKSLLDKSKNIESYDAGYKKEKKIKIASIAKEFLSGGKSKTKKSKKTVIQIKKHKK